MMMVRSLNVVIAIVVTMILMNQLTVSNISVSDPTGVVKLDTAHVSNNDRQENDEKHSSSSCVKEAGQKILQRMYDYQNDHVKYDFYHYHKEYRSQCSGFVSYAWDVASSTTFNNATTTTTQNNYTRSNTLRCYELETHGIAHVISKDELRLGDAMVCNTYKYKLKGTDKPRKELGQQSGGHCLIFEKWVDSRTKSSFIGWEHCKDKTCHDTTRREIPYPYFYKKGCWEPMRYTKTSELC